MNEKENTGVSASGSEPGKFWLWALAVIQLPAVMLLTWVGIGETMVKIVGFAILLLCGSMDIKAVKKAGYQVPRWWWGLAVFLPPAYMICRVLKTDTALPERMKRFAPAVVWGLLFVCMVVGMVSSQEQSDPLAVADAFLEAIYEDGDVDTVAQLSGVDPSDAHAMRYLKRMVEDTWANAQMNNESVVETVLRSVNGDVATVAVGIMDDEHRVHIQEVLLYREKGRWFVGEKKGEE